MWFYNYFSHNNIKVSQCLLPEKKMIELILLELNLKAFVKVYSLDSKSRTENMILLCLCSMLIC